MAPIREAVDERCEGDRIMNFFDDRNAFSEDDVRDCFSQMGSLFSFNRLVGVAVSTLFFEILQNFPISPCSVSYTCFGFCDIPRSEHSLLRGLYQELILRFGFKPEECYAACLWRGALSAVIESKFSPLSRSKRGQFYEWFLLRRSVLDSVEVLGCRVHDGVYPRSLYSQNSWPGMRISTAYHLGDKVASLEVMQSKISEHFQSEVHPLKKLTKTEIAVTTLYYEVLCDSVPTRTSIAFHRFGFSNVHPLDRRALLEVYKGLICDLGCERWEFLGAYESGRIYELIAVEVSKSPATWGRGCYGEWFVPRIWLFESLKAMPNDVDLCHSNEGIPVMVASGEVIVLPKGFVHAVVSDHLTEDERRCRRFENMTRNKADVVILFFGVLENYTSLLHPWKFGSEANSPRLRDNVIRLFQSLIIWQRCKLEEFLHAYEEGKVFELVERMYSMIPESDRGFYDNKFLEECKPFLKRIKAGEFWRNSSLLQNLASLRLFGSNNEESFLAVSCLYEDIHHGNPLVLSPMTSRFFGFDSLDKLSDRMLLFLLYKCLVIDEECSKEEFFEAYESGTLKEVMSAVVFKRVLLHGEGRLANWFNAHKELFDNVRASTEDGPATSVEELCGMCKKIAKLRCSKCGKQRYCSKDHQKQDWKIHKKVCRG